MRCCRRRRWLSALVALWLLIGAPTAAVADGVQVRQAALVDSGKDYYLEAEFDITLTPTLEEALSKGVPLYFLLQFELNRKRWYWFNDEVAVSEQEYRLSFNALTRQYRVAVGTLYENFVTLRQALGFLSKVRIGPVAETESLTKGARYTAGVRLRLDDAQLPRSFRVSAVGSREWSVGSDWFQWTVTP